MKLKEKLLLAIIFVSVIPIMVLGYFSYKLGVDNVVRIEKKEFGKVIDNQINIIENKVDGAEEELDYISQLLGKDKVEAELYMSKVVERNASYKSLYFATPKNEFYLVPHEDLPDGFDSRQRPWYLGAKGTKTMVNTDPYKDAVSNEMLVTLAKSVYKDGKFIGVLGIDLNLQEFTKSISNIVVGETGYLYIVTHDGTTLVHPRKEFIGSSLFDTVPELKVIDEKKTGEVYYDFEGKEKFIVYKTFNKLNWVMSGGTYTREFSKEFDSVRNAILIILGIVLLLSILIIYLAQKTICDPILTFIDKFKMGANGDLTSRVSITSKDELGMLGEEYNKFMIKLSELIESIIGISSKVDEENGKLALIMNDIVNGSENSNENLEKGIVHLQEYIQISLDNIRNQTAAAEESLAGLEQISAASNNIKENIFETRDSSNDALHQAKSSITDMENMYDKMGDINTKVSETNFEIDGLLSYSKEIENILDVINGISEQTNLLALNAAIEAARAGDAGRGFAVVADEIRALAEQTNRQTSKIEDIVNGIHNKVDSVKDANDMVTNNVKDGLEMSEKVKELLLKIIEITEKNTNSINNITRDIEEQNTATSEITTAVGNITENSITIEEHSMSNHEISDKISKVLVDRLDTVVDLSKMANKLSEDLNYFKL